MTITLFISIFTIGALAAGLLTEAVKKAYKNAGVNYSANKIALINAAIIGGFGTASAYVLLDIAWTIQNIICLVLMVFLVWIGAMIGYDKIIQMLAQIRSITKGGKT